MALGRTVVGKKFTYGGAQTLIYNDGSSEDVSFLETVEQGDIEDLDSNSKRIGWVNASIHTVYTGSNFTNSSVTSINIIPDRDDFSYMVEILSKLESNLILLEIEGTKIKEVTTLQELLESGSYGNYVSTYTSDKIKLTKLDKQAAKILYNK